MRQRNKPELLESSDESEGEDDFHARRRAFRARVVRGPSMASARADAGPVGGRAGVASTLLSKLSEVPGSRASKDKPEEAKPVARAAKPALPPPKESPEPAALEDSESASNPSMEKVVAQIAALQEEVMTFPCLQCMDGCSG